MSDDTIARCLQDASRALDQLRTLISDPLPDSIAAQRDAFSAVWSNLDRARRSLASRGIAVLAFDQVRRKELVDHGVDNANPATEANWLALAERALSGSGFRAETINRAVAARDSLAAMSAGNLMAAGQSMSSARALTTRGRKLAMVGGLILGLGGLAVAAVVLLGIERSPRIPTDVNESVYGFVNTQLLAVRRKLTELHEHDIARLRALYPTTCAPAVRAEYVRALRAGAHLSDAERVEREPCIPDRPSCATARPVLDKRFHEVIECKGIRVGSRDRLTPALLVIATAMVDDRPSDQRGIVSIDGTRDVVGFVTAPGTQLAGIGDLDDDRVDEYALVGGADQRSLWVTRVRDGRFVDIAAPTLAKQCSAEAHIERDLRDDRKSERSALKIAVAEDIEGCPTAGTHYFVLVNDELVDDS